MMRFVILAAFLIGCDGKEGETDTRVTDILALTGDTANGEALFGTDCAICHGTDGSGGSGPSLVAKVPELSEEEILDVVINGEDSMPAFDGWTDQELADVLAYLTTTFG